MIALLLLAQLLNTQGVLQCRATTTQSRFLVSDKIPLRGEFFYIDPPSGETIHATPPAAVWAQLSGPAGVKIVPDTHTLSPVVTVPQAGIYTFQLVVGTSQHIGACSVKVVVERGRKA